MQSPRIKSFIASLAILAFAFYTLLPFFAVYQLPKESDAKHMASVFGEKIILCTAEGFKLVDLQSLFNGKQLPKPHSDYQCALCYVAAHGQANTPPASNALTVPLLSSLEQTPTITTNQNLTPEQSWQKRFTRSPPLSFIS